LTWGRRNECLKKIRQKGGSRRKGGNGGKGSNRRPNSCEERSDALTSGTPHLTPGASARKRKKREKKDLGREEQGYVIEEEVGVTGWGKKKGS